MPIIRVPKVRRDIGFTSVRIRKPLLDLVNQFIEEAPTLLEFPSTARVVERAVEEFLFKWSQFNTILPFVPQPYKCPECKEVVTLLPLTSPGFFVFREIGHKAGRRPCKYFRADYDQAMEWRKRHPKLRLEDWPQLARLRYQRYPVWASFEVQVEGPRPEDRRKYNPGRKWAAGKSEQPPPVGDQESRGGKNP